MPFDAPQHVETFDAVVVGGGPAGATAAHELAKLGRSVLLLDKAHRIKPCGGAIPPRLIRDFAIPESQIVARAKSARALALTTCGKPGSAPRSPALSTATAPFALACAMKSRPCAATPCSAANK